MLLETMENGVLEPDERVILPALPPPLPDVLICCSTRRFPPAERLTLPPLPLLVGVPRPLLIEPAGTVRLPPTATAMLPPLPPVVPLSALSIKLVPKMALVVAPEIVIPMLPPLPEPEPFAENVYTTDGNE